MLNGYIQRVGGGTAGSVVASRLSEVRQWKVLLLEAGGPPPPESHVPAFSLTFYLPGSYTWPYYITPQKHSHKSYVGRSERLLQGRMLGGSSSVGGLLYMRGSRNDYDQWAVLGNPGWDYLSVLPYFRKSENYQGEEKGYSELYHGREGPMAVTPTRKLSRMTKAFLQAGQELGYNIIDPNGHEQIGFAPADYTVFNGIRGSTAENFLRPAASRPNLHIVHSATVHKIVMNKKRAVGVQFIHRGKLKKAWAVREVVVSAGALSSPKILMLSGLGPAQHLQEHGVPVVLDLPGVGTNLQDHFNIQGLTWTVPQGVLNPPNNLVALHQYLNNRTGPFSEPLGEKTSAWVTVTPEGVTQEDPNWPNVQCHILTPPISFDLGFLTPELTSLEYNSYVEYFRPVFGKEGFTMACHIMRPKSRGTVTLRSNDPQRPPLIDPNYLSHPDDLATLVSAVRFLLKVGNTTALARGLSAEFHDKPLPGCETETYDSDAYWACYVSHLAASYLHPAGTCKMGPPTDPFSVLDHQL
ncbi:glucose dehydrogenase [FAD, quinone], partial [Cherax quadricarinatus]|uniref:glucose dehydrogenase [FAD, quinone] n=1 Tax=Cherax quadricarinatus TaxID=27406 RepID=UPI00387E4BF0